MFIRHSFSPLRRSSRPARFVVIALACLTLRPLIAFSADTEAERLARLEAAVQALQAQNADLKREVSELKQHKPAKPIAAPATATATRKEDDRKAIVETKLEEKKPVYVTPAGVDAKLVLGGFVQGQYEIGDVSAYDGRFRGPLSAKTKDRFRLRRARISVSGEFADQFEFKLEGGFETNDTTLNVRDASGRSLVNNTNRTSFGATDVWVNWHAIPEMNLKLGQFKAPFGLEQLSPDAKLLTIERSQVTEALTPERQIGLQVWGKPFASAWPEQKDLLTYSAGIFNGSGRNTTTNDNNEYMYVGRLEAQLFSGRLAGQDAAVKLGGNYFTSRDERGVNISQTGNLLVTTDGSLSAFVLPSGDQRNAFGVDGSLHFGPFDLVGEYLNERVRPRSIAGVGPAFSRFNADGYYLTGAYYLVPKKLQLVAKWESFNPGQVANDDLQSISGGLNYYIHGDDVKLMADYLHTWSDFRQHNPRFGDDQFDEVLVRLQLLF
ncbi:MAG: porin [Verrucomicrobiota bacterium]|nr:porin [Verrucomicrobiota bacterium]